jgi:hypothetical protein
MTKSASNRCVFVVSSLAGIVLKLPRVSAPANASATTRDEKCLARGREIGDVLALIDVSNPSVEANALGEFSRMVVARLVLDRAFIVDLFP